MEALLTTHAQARMQQRGISPAALGALLDFDRDGTVVTVGHRYRRIQRI